MISLATSLVNDKVRKYVNDALDENRLGGGRFVKEFEKAVAKYHGAKHAIAVCNGSMADIVALAALKEQQPDRKEVIVPAFTFVAQTNAILINGLKPVFVDVNEHGQLAYTEVKKYINENTLAIFPANLLGRRADVMNIRILANKYKIFVVEDSCEAYGVWTKSDFATFSFFPSHTITTGEGGMIITNNDKHAEMARKIANHGRMSDKILEKFHFDYLGYNGKMSNVLAAIGCAVVDTADGVIEKRKENVKLYNEILRNDWYAESPHCYPIFYQTTKERDAILIKLEKNGVEARKLFSCIPTKEYGWMGDYPNSEYFGAVGLFVPVHQDITKEDIKKITSLL